MQRIWLRLSGTVQGVGLRPSVAAAARAHGLSGVVRNVGGRVELEAQGPTDALARFEQALRQSPPPIELRDIERRELTLREQEVDFVIVESRGADMPPALPPDLAPCPDCLQEVTAKAGRRAGYPFTACARCGPRYSIVEALPYDRAKTTLRDFVLCQQCQREYDDVTDRRCHAQAIACPACGPELELRLNGENVRGTVALQRSAEFLESGGILALQGVGGFQLLVDACNDEAVRRLRERKLREQKPFAVLFENVAMLERHAWLSQQERALVTGPEAPIVLLTRREDSGIAPSVAPDNPQLGALLPASPLHLLLAARVERPLVCTSGNPSGEPLCRDSAEAFARLTGIADAFLLNNRPIARPLDDSVARVGPHGPLLLRRGRGYAPRVVARLPGAPSVLALGADLKAAPALLTHGDVVLGQHVGDLSEASANRVFTENVADLLRFFACRPALVACDRHPDYGSTRLAEQLAAELGSELVRVQHHHAHIAAVLAERGVSGPALGVAWDGTGWGDDGTIWGGELLIVDGARAERWARLPTFALPGGDRAARDPWRSALGLLFEVAPELARQRAHSLCDEGSANLVLSALERGVNAPRASSVGRLFDAVAALTGAPQRTLFEGQAAMRLEFAARGRNTPEGYPLAFELLQEPGATLAPFVLALLADVDRGLALGEIAAKFQRGLVEAVVRAANRAGLRDIALSGGCFQNQLLLDGVTAALEGRGHRVHTAGQIPPNDGGIAAGQAAVAAWAHAGR